MKKSKSIYIFLTVALALCISLFLAGCAGAQNDGTDSDSPTSSLIAVLDGLMNAEQKPKIDFAKLMSDTTAIVYSSTESGAQKIAYSMQSDHLYPYKLDFPMVKDSDAERNTEIIIGASSRPLTERLIAEAQKYPEAVYLWGYAYEDGKFAYYYDSKESFDRSIDEFCERFVSGGDFLVSEGMLEIHFITQEDLDKEEEENMEKRIEELKKMNSAFTEEQFGKNSYRHMIDAENGYFNMNPCPEPPSYPTKGEHPRYLINAENVEKIRAILADPFYSNLSSAFWELANSGADEHYWGNFPIMQGKTGTYRYDSRIIAMIEAKAMAYLVTGNEAYALEAIICIKNAILTLNYTKDIHVDPYHGPSHLMITVAEVYDWCYAALSETDKWQLIYATATNLGMGLEAGMQYPPSGMNGISGHGTGPQLLRDWVSVSSAFYDEVPDWWSFVLGRYFEEYLPVANMQFESGWVSQGTACYAPLKIHVQAMAAYIVKTATGRNYLTEDAKYTTRFLMSHIMPSGRYFQTGDGSRVDFGTKLTFSEYFVVAALYNDPIAYAYAREVCEDHSVFFFTEAGMDSIVTMTPGLQLCFTSAVDYNGETVADSLNTIEYFGGPALQMTARSSYDENASAILMKIGGKTMANHDVYDHGSFQIYYKGLLAASSGSYKSYGGASHYYYHQSTIAHNGLLIFNPSLADAEPIYDSNGRMLNADRYYYSGSQDRRVEAGSLERWTGGEYDMGESLGAAWGYYTDGSPKYAYIAGDITSSYSPLTVDFVGRNMLTIFTGDENFPTLFITYDRISSIDEDFTKTWLLHVAKEPSVSDDGLCATVINGEGKMLVKSLFGGDGIEKVGGEGRAYWIDGYYADPDDQASWVEGKNCTDSAAMTDNANLIWGRLQIRESGERDSEFLTLMAITDKDNESEIEVCKYESDSAYAMRTLGVIAVFPKERELLANELSVSISSESDSLYDYYITGLASGTWRVYIDGEYLGNVYSTKTASFISFKAKAGELKLVPSADVEKDIGGEIKYNTNGGTLPDNAPTRFDGISSVTLPDDVVRGDDVFLGWYTTPTFEENSRITEIPIGANGSIKIWAKWNVMFAKTDFEASNFDVTAASDVLIFEGLGLRAVPSGTSLKTVSEDGNKYIKFTVTSADAHLLVQNDSYNLTNMSSDILSISLRILPIDGEALARTQINIATSGSAYGQLELATVDHSSGNIILANSQSVVASVKGEAATLNLLVDFENGTVSAVDSDGTLIASSNLVIPTSAVSSAAEWKKVAKNYLLYVRMLNHASSGAPTASIGFDDILVAEGNAFLKSADDTDKRDIKYYSGGATLPKNAPYTYSDTENTPLPTPTRAGDVFVGWYTTPTFDKGSEISEIKAGTVGTVRVYAKWSRVYADADFNDTAFDVTEASDVITHDGIGLRVVPDGSSLKTELDGDDKYVKFTVGDNDAHLMVRNDSENLTTMSSNILSIGIDILPIDGENLMNTRIMIATTGSEYGQLLLATVNPNTGDVCLANSSVAIANVKEGRARVRLAVDFASETVSAYDEDGSLIASSRLTNPTNKVSSLAEWKKVAKNYLLYVYMKNAFSANGETSSIGFDNVIVADENIFS